MCNITVLELLQAYYDCRKHKRNTYNALKFEEHLETNIMDLYHDLIHDRYQIGRSICFVITKPKPREVWAADFRDRIVHHLIYNKFFHIFTKSFIHDSYACLPNKGTLNAAKRLEKFLRSSSHNYKRKTYFLKADIKNFFMTINKDIMFELICKKVNDKWWQNLIHKVLYNDCVSKAIVKSPKKLLNLIPKQKSLFNANKTCGLPIGNLSSQFFANIYLNELDQYIKRDLKCIYYIRYVDDIVIIDQSHQRLNQIYDKICIFTKDVLHIEFHDKKKQLNTIDKGINFVGYIVKPYRKYIRRSTIKNLYNRTKIMKNYRQSLNSYFGMLIHANTYREREHIQKFYSKIKFNKSLTKCI